MVAKPSPTFHQREAEKTKTENLFLGVVFLQAHVLHVLHAISKCRAALFVRRLKPLSCLAKKKIKIKISIIP